MDDHLDPFDNSWIDRPIFARFELIAEAKPDKSDKLALDDTAFRFTYREVQLAARVKAPSTSPEANVPSGG